MGQVLGIYVHIPFCRSKCDYCDFYSLAGQEEWMDRYQKALLLHIKATGALLKDYQVDTIYFGGGTPSYYGERRLRELLATLRRSFSVSKTPEITVECNPDSVDRKSISRLKRSGFNRISLGMQSADCTQLSSLHRPHSYEDVEEAIKIIREAKVDNLSLDLIYGLPGQTLESWQETLEKAIALEPDHLSAYGLKVEEGTPLAMRAEEGEPLPDEDLQADMYLWMTSRLPKAGFRQYELSNFARTGKESRHNLKYWMGREYIGFGPDAHSDIDGRRYAYCKDLERYISGIQGSGDLLEDLEDISKQERAKEYLMLRMRTLRGIEEWEYRREFYMNFEPIQRKLELFESRGWVMQSGHRWHFTSEGFLISNRLILELLESQGQAPQVLLTKEEQRLPLFSPQSSIEACRSSGFKVLKRKPPSKP
jgi:oxygen-independent coproporphyrinogen-3 oxidase